MYARMVIGEANSEEQVQEFARIYTSEVLPELETEPGFAGARFMVEEDGRMAVSLTVWTTREDCVRYNCSRSYRQFVARTQHLLIGDFVVKLFQDLSHQ
jgi:heme-degrading monooxygenase HmoA